MKTANYNDCGYNLACQILLFVASRAWIVEANKRIHSFQACSARLVASIQASYFFLDCLLFKSIIGAGNKFKSYAVGKFLLILESLKCKI